MARTVQVRDERYNGLFVRSQQETRSIAGLVEHLAKEAGIKTFSDAETVALCKKNGWAIPEYLMEVARAQ